MPPPPPDIALAPEQFAPFINPPPLRSLGRVHRSVAVPARGSFWAKFGAFMGPGYLVAVGYMDPGNWATDLAGGSRHGYDLLWVILLSSLVAMLLQALSARLGIASGMDLAQGCRQRYRPSTRIALWLLAEGAIIACDLAEVIGTAVALQLLFGIPLWAGVCLTAVNVVIAIGLERRGFRRLEALVASLMVIIGLCLAAELVLAQPSVGAVAAGLIPSARVVADPATLYLAIGIIGATVMPHNLYLHSAVVQTRSFGRAVDNKREAIKFATIDSMVALSLAMLVNGAILVLAASAFHTRGQTVTELGDAYRLLSPMLGAGAASMLFGIALLASGQNSTLTGTLAGQIVMEGFTDFRMPAWARRMISRAIAIVPAAAAAILYGGSGVDRLLILSQVVLSIQLPFAIVPLMRLTGDPGVMGPFANGPAIKIAAWSATALLIGLNLALIAGMIA